MYSFPFYTNAFVLQLVFSIQIQLAGLLISCVIKEGSVSFYGLINMQIILVLMAIHSQEQRPHLQIIAQNNAASPRP